MAITAAAAKVQTKRTWERYDVTWALRVEPRVHSSQSSEGSISRQLGSRRGRSYEESIGAQTREYQVKQEKRERGETGEATGNGGMGVLLM